jgi:hypothetical protein
MFKKISLKQKTWLLSNSICLVVSAASITSSHAMIEYDFGNGVRVGVGVGRAQRVPYPAYNHYQEPSARVKYITSGREVEGRITREEFERLQANRIQVEFYERQKKNPLTLDAYLWRVDHGEKVVARITGPKDLPIVVYPSTKRVESRVVTAMEFADLQRQGINVKFRGRERSNGELKHIKFPHYQKRIRDGHCSMAIIPGQ